jgi:TatD DNase family protein
LLLALAPSRSNAKRQTPNAKRQTPNAKRQTPNAKRQTPNAQRQTPNEPPLTDTHAHLDFPELVSELDEIIERATTAGVTRIIAIGTTVASSRKAIQIAAKYPGVYATIGVHPTHAAEVSENFIDELRELAAQPKVVAIGEIGLDYFHLPSRGEKEDVIQTTYRALSAGSVELLLRDQSEKATQAVVFQEQLELAEALDLPVVIHQRDSLEDTLAIIQEYPITAVFHCFNASPAQALDLVQQGYYVSFTGIVTFKKAGEVRDAAAAISIDRLMVETDAPYLAPVPFRGKRCEPAYTRETAQAIARARGISFEMLAEVTTRNANRFFRLPEI